MKTTWLLGLAMVGLTACGPLQENNRLAATAERLIARANADDSTPQAATAALSRAQIEAQPAELLRVSLISFESTSVLVKAAENGPKITWQSGEDIGFTFERGLLIGTRGLGHDLMGSDVSGAIASLSGGGNHLRTLDFLNGLGQIERRTYQCLTVKTDREDITIFDITYSTIIIEETCTSPAGDFKNTYWRDAGGVIWQSRQWISDNVGYLGYQRL